MRKPYGGGGLRRFLFIPIMNILTQCTTCFRRQAESVLTLTNADDSVRASVAMWLETLLLCLPSDKPPAFISRVIQRRIESLTGISDPYHEIKRRTNAFALSLVPHYQNVIKSNDNPMITALRLAAAGNIIDYGAKRSLTDEEAHTALSSAIAVPLHGGFEQEVAEKLYRAKSVLIIADNSGEIVFDRLLCEILPCRPFVAVRSAPIINDATLDDAAQIGLFDVADVIETGSDLPGVHPPYISEQMRELMRDCDVVIAKGQGNFEGLQGSDYCGYFLFRVKCEPVSAHCRIEIGNNILVHASRVFDSGVL